MSHAPKHLRLKAGLPTIILITVAIVAALAWNGYQHRLEDFDGERWRADTSGESGVRLKMADGLIARGTLNGLTRPELVELLGEPSPQEYFRNWDMVYRLGDERGFISIDWEWLVIRLNSDGRVAEYRIVTD